MIKLLTQLGLPFIIFLSISCDKKTVFNQNKDFKNAKWFIKEECTFDIVINDPSKPFKLYYNVRNNLTYPYYNLYVTRYLYDEKGKKIEEKLDEIILADEKTGKPLGTGLGDIFDHKVLVSKNYTFPAKGKYKMVVKQFMRQNPLPDVLSFGIALEKEITEK
jgi:gliding motility-associated lipoprotein GldH